MPAEAQAPTRSAGPPTDVRFVAGLAIALLAFGWIPVSPALYVPVNLAVAAALLAAGRRAGLAPRDLGLGAWRSGARAGGLAAAALATGLAAGLAVPALRPLFDDARVAGAGWGLVAYRALVRIPLGTVLLEEVAFRGVLLAAWRRVAGTWPAVLGSSAVFGLWHIRPALELIDANEAAAGMAETVAGVALAVAGTAAGGAVFCWLRLRSGSLVAPIVAHAALNSLALVAAFLVTG